MIYFTIFLLCGLLSKTTAKPLETQTESRSFGNFGPSIETIVDFDPAFQPEPAESDPAAIAKQYIEKHSGEFQVTSRVSSFYRSAHIGVTHVYFQQLVNGLEVSNGVANVNVDDKGKVISSGNSFFRHGTPSSIEPFEPTLSAADAVISFATFLKLEVPSSSSLQIETRDGELKVSGAPFAKSPISAAKKYIQVDGGSRLAHVWGLQVEMERNFYHTHVDSSSGNVIALNDWVSDVLPDATYNVFPLGTNDPQKGPRVVVKNPSHLLGSPLRWQSQGVGKDFTVTISNNVYAQNNPDGENDYSNNHRPDAGSSLNFNYPLDLTKAPADYVDASITNLFYWNNIIHDLYYAYGFTEAAGNFQQNNLLRGGKGNDAVIAFAQDGSGTNNANFATPPDGQHGVMRMYVFTVTTPKRDGDLDNGVITHEYTHGLSNRLTGGPSNVDCLPDGEAGGMGEGWGDFVATILRTTRLTKRSDNFPIGAYVTGRRNGIRHYLYSTNLRTNPTTYGFLQQPEYSEVHNAGEIWVEMLWEVYWNLVDRHGYTSDWFKNSKWTDGDSSKGGNIMMLQLVVDGMKLQPCKPTFLNARDYILQADRLNYNGINRCLIWKGFARRGLGVNAKPGGEESFKFPSDC